MGCFAGLLAFGSSGLRAQAPPDGSEDDAGDNAGATAPSDVASMTGDRDPAEVGKKKKKKAKKGRSDSGISIGARVFVRDTAAKAVVDGAEWQNELEVSSARLNIDVRRYGWLRGSLEVEFSNNDLELKDVFLRAKVYEMRRMDITVQVGNFKRPISPIALTSVWDLPVIERGILNERVLTANYFVPLNLGGRSEGVMVTYENKASVRPEVSLGLFNARLPTRTGAGADIGDQADNLLRDVYLRAQIEPIGGFTVGGTLVGFTQARFADDLRTRFLGSLDVTLDTTHFRAWLEGFAGRTPFFDGTESIGGLIGLRVLLAGRLHRPTPWLYLLEPYAMISVLDPTDELQDNQSSELSAGLTTYFRKNFRLQLEYSRTFNENEFPQPDFAILDRQVLRLQLGARFR